MSSRTPIDVLVARVRLAVRILLGSGQPDVLGAADCAVRAGDPRASGTPRGSRGEAAAAARGTVELERGKLLATLIAVYDQERSRTLRGTIRQTLSEVGVEEHDPTGERFDPERHVATARVPAEDVAQEGLIAAVELTGLRDRRNEIRQPRVVVYGEQA